MAADANIQDSFKKTLQPMLTGQTTAIKNHIDSNREATLSTDVENRIADEVVTKATAEIERIAGEFDLSKLEDIMLFVQASENAFPGIKREMKKLREEGKDGKDSDSKSNDRYDGEELLKAAKASGDQKLIDTVEFQNKWLHYRVWEHRQTRGLVVGLAAGAAATIAVQRFMAARAENADVDGMTDAGVDGDVAFEVMSA
jgi:hypothetical protein